MSYLIPISKHINELDLNQGTFIFLHRASKIPPHIGLIVNGKIFEITTTGPGYNLSAELLLKTAKKRSVELVFIELIPTSKSIEEIEQLITSLVKHYGKVTNCVSCLLPIKDFIETLYKIDVKSSNFIFELLPILYSENLVKDSFELNLTHKLVQQNFILNTYSKLQVEHVIKSVNRKNNIEVSR